MDHARASKIKILIVVIVVVVILLVIAGVCWKKWKSVIGNGFSGSSSNGEKDSLSSWRKMAGIGKRPIVGAAQEPLVDTRDPAYNLAFPPELDRIRRLIFPKLISDVNLLSPTDLTKEPGYQELMMGLKKYDRALTKEELEFLLKYYKFLNSPEIHSMCGPREIEQSYLALLHVASNKIPGDIVETGVWRGGMSMWMKAVVNHLQETNRDSLKRKSWLFDAFDQFPAPASIPMDDGSEIPPHQNDLKVHALTLAMYQHPPTAEQVRDNFQKLDLLDDKVKLIKGLFSRTIPLILRSQNQDTMINEIAVLRLDNDYYDSVFYVLEKLYPKVSQGGIVIIDDYNNPALGCKDAVRDFRAKYQITNPIIDKHGGSVYWEV